MNTPANQTPPVKTKAGPPTPPKEVPKPPEKAAKAPKAPKDPNAPPKVRGPRKDYGYSLDSKIEVTNKEQTFRGQRLEWYEALKAANGKTVKDFLDATKDKKDPGRGWLRFFVQEEAVILHAPPAPPAAPAAQPEAPKPA
jgi:hypothetical protein